MYFVRSSFRGHPAHSQVENRRQRPQINAIQFTKIVIRSLSDAHPDLPEDARLCIDVILDGKTCLGPSPVAKELAAFSWRLTDDILLSASIPSFTLVVRHEFPTAMRLGSIELSSPIFFRQPTGHDCDLALVGAGDDSPPLKLAFTSSILCMDPPLRPHPLFPESIDANLLTHLCSFADEDYDETLILPDDTPEKARRLYEVGDLFKKRYSLLSNLADLDKANLAYENATHLTPDSDPNKPNGLSNLGHAFWRLFRLRGDTVDGDKSIQAFEEAVRLTPDSHPRKSRRLGDLGDFYLRRLRDIADIEMSILVFENAVRLAPEDAHDKPVYLNGLARSLLLRFERFEDIADINKSISAADDAVRLTPDRNRHKLAYQKSLGATLLRRFERLRDVTDIDKSISMLENVEKRTIRSHPNKPGCLNDVAGALLRRFERLGDIADLDRSILALEEAVKLPQAVLGDAVSLTPDRQGKLKRLVNLGNALSCRFTRLGDIADIDRSILMVEEAVRCAPDDYPEKYGFLGMLGSCFQARFRRLENIADINTSVLRHEEAVNLTPHDHPDKAHYLSTLGASLLNRFIGRKDIADLKESILAQEYALTLIPHDHPGRPSCLTGLGSSLMLRFRQLGDIADIDMSISVIDDAVQRTPADHPAKSQRLIYLGNSFWERFRRLHHRSDFDMAVLQFRRVAQSSYGPPSIQLNGAMSWARLALMDDTSLAIDAYTIVLDLLPRVAWLGLTITERHRVLGDVGSTVTEAAAIAIEHKKYETAVEWLDHGRSIVWSQLLHLRTPVDELRVVEPELADRLTQISQDLEQASTRNEFIGQGERLSAEQAAQRHRQLAKEWDELIEKTRAVRGFEDFLRPKKLKDLRNAARFGPVVVLNVHKRRCDALVIMVDLDDTVHIPLDRFSYNRAQDLQRSLNKLLSNANVRMRGTRVVSIRGREAGFETILSELWLDVVKPVLDRLEFSKMPDEYALPRIWWCATGPLAFLPIHASGLYGSSKSSGSKIYDFVISSYTTTLTAILEKPRQMPRQFRGLLTITQPNTPGQAPLPGAEKELIHIQSRARNIRMESLLGAKATVESVLGSIATCSWVHLACHAVQIIAEPTKSAFCLHNGDLQLSEIIKLSLPHADFAFLSACQTATGNEKLSEEAVHLAAGMLSAGYQSVIATMWSISDKDAPLIADDVYSDLLKDGEPDSTRAAYALHRTVKKLRQQSGESSFLSWVPFIHVGI